MENHIKLEQLREEKIDALNKHLSIQDRIKAELQSFRSITDHCIEQLKRTREEWQLADKRFNQYIQSIYPS